MAGFRENLNHYIWDVLEFDKFMLLSPALFFLVLGIWYFTMKDNKGIQRQIRKISDKVYDLFNNDTGRPNLTFKDLYIAVLLVFNDINKLLPGPHFDPPSKEDVKAMMEECDINLDRELDREEFVKFIQRLTKDTFITVSQGLIITLALAPTVALMTKRSTEGVPGIGKVVQKVPNSVYASLVTLVVVAFQKAAFEN